MRTSRQKDAQSAWWRRHHHDDRCRPGARQGSCKMTPADMVAERLQRSIAESCRSKEENRGLR